MKHFYCIINQAAGSFSQQRVSRFLSFLEREGAAVTLCIPHDRAEAIKRARCVVQESAATHILVGGGDGTIADIASVMIGSALVLCILPIGTANVLAHELGVPTDDRSHARLLVFNKARKMWPGIGTGPKGSDLFIQMAGFGLDGAIVRNVSTFLKKRIGRYAYVVSGLLTLLRYKETQHRVWVDDTLYQCACFIVSKGRFYGGEYVIAPETQYFAKVFNVILIKQVSIIALAKILFQNVIYGTIETSGVVNIIPAQRVTISEGADLPVQMDGDACLQSIRTLECSEEPLWVAY